MKAPVAYRAYGVTLTSDIPLPELESCEGLAAEIVVTLARTQDGADTLPWRPLIASEGETWASWCRDAGDLLVRFRGMADFRVGGKGGRITVRSAAGVPAATLRHLLLDQVLPRVLHLRGRDVMHASAVETPAGACAFVAPSGGGKSTLAAVCRRAGDRLLGDDALVIERAAGVVKAIPAYPGLRLWRDAAHAVGEPEGEPVAHYVEKRRIAVPGFDPQPTLLRRIYLIVRGGAELPAARVEPIASVEATMALVGASFRLDLEDRARHRRELEALSDVVRVVPVRRLVVPESLPRVHEVRDAVVRDLAI